MSPQIMQLNQKSKDSDGSFAQTKYPKMKITLFYKLHIVNACFLFVIISVISFTPITAKASLLSSLTDFILGESATADETIVKPSSYGQNSQNIPLLEASIDPDLKKINEIDNSSLIQDDLFINSESLFVPSVDFEKSTISDQIKVYTVLKGDTISDIADNFDVSVNTIRWENNISGQTVSVGQKLNILPVTGVKHTVKKGDTVNAIADRYEADAEDILIFNGVLSGNSLKQGDILFIPNGIIKPVEIKNTVKTSSTKAVSSSSNTKAPAGYYIKPVQGIITSPYGSRRGGFHYGVDIGNKRGTTVVAAASGVVTRVVSGCVEGKSSCGGRYGNLIIIEHSNGTRTFYAHLSSVNVSVGQSVSKGKKIGALGNTGSSTGPHLHFEVENANGSKMRPPIY